MDSELKPRILLFTGDGKGKTTAAVGMALRASGHGLRCLIIQFVKCDDKTGEIAACANIPQIKIMQTGMGFVPNCNSDKFVEHKAAAERGLDAAGIALSSGDYDIVVLDEICVAVSMGLLDVNKALEVIGKARPGSVVVMTGRNAAQELIQAADTVTAMTCVKHGFNEGIKARVGVEY